MGVFEDRPVNTANRILPRLTSFKEILDLFGVVLVSIMITNPSSNRSRSQCENSISLVLVDIRVEVIYFGRK